MFIFIYVYTVVIESMQYLAKDYCCFQPGARVPTYPEACSFQRKEWVACGSAPRRPCVTLFLYGCHVVCIVYSKNKQRTHVYICMMCLGKYRTAQFLKTGGGETQNVYELDRPRMSINSTARDRSRRRASKMSLVGHWMGL